MPVKDLLDDVLRERETKAREKLATLLASFKEYDRRIYLNYAQKFSYFYKLNIHIINDFNICLIYNRPNLYDEMCGVSSILS